MKKALLSVVVFAAALCATSCTNEMESFENFCGEKESTVRFVVKAPMVQTRAGIFGNGTTAQDLYYAVYDKDGEIVEKISKITAENKQTINLETTVEFKLVNGNTYSIIFWAESSDSVATIDWENQTMTYNPTKANTEGYDAFWAYVEPFKVTGPIDGPDVDLFRPFAQINVGTDDFEFAADAGSTMLTAGISVTLPNVLNLVTGEVSGNATTMLYEETAFPTAPEEFPISGYKYLSMNYVLVKDVKELITLNFNYSSATQNYTYEWTNVPVRRNYRTNVYGSIFTEDAKYKVTIQPTLTDDPEYNYTY